MTIAYSAFPNNVEFAKEMGPKVYINVIYTREDKEVMLNLLQHLNPLKEAFEISIWHDDPIDPKQLWKPQIESRKDETDIFLLLVSDAFMHSEFIKQLEFKLVIDRYKEDKATVIPIIVDNCQWGIDFKSDDYDFNLKELQVLPEGGKPIGDWNPPDQAYKQVTDYMKGLIDLGTENDGQAESEMEQGERESNSETEDQLAMSFSDEEAEAKSRAEEEKRLKEMDEAKKRSGEEKRLREEAEAKRMAEEEKRVREETEAKRKAEEEKRVREEAEAKRKAEEEKRVREEIEVKRKAEEENRDREEAETKRRAEAEKKVRQEAEAAANRMAAEEKRLREEAETKGNVGTADQPKYATEAKASVEETQPKNNSAINRRVLWGSLVAVLIVVGIWTFSIFDTDSEKQAPTSPNSEATGAKDPIAPHKTDIDSENQGEPFSKLAVGDYYEGGIIFTIDPSNKTGKIAHVEDAGPMPWKNAMEIHGQLGEGWRLPTFNELSIMYRTIGQGATNSGEFADGLYWSATPYDEYQARLLRFRDGNPSYHYNKEVEHRKFLVRAVKDLSQ